MWRLVRILIWTDLKHNSSLHWLANKSSSSTTTSYYCYSRSIINPKLNSEWLWKRAEHFLPQVFSVYEWSTCGSSWDRSRSTHLQTQWGWFLDGNLWNARTKRCGPHRFPGVEAEIGKVKRQNKAIILHERKHVFVFFLSWSISSICRQIKANYGFDR